MNLRTSKLAEEIIEGLHILDIPDDVLLIVNLPSGLDTITTRNIGESITSALKALGKTNPILLMPKDIKLSTLTDLDMKELGYVRTTPGNSTDSGLCTTETSIPIVKTIVQEHKLWSSCMPDVSEFIKQYVVTQHGTWTDNFTPPVQGSGNWGGPINHTVI